MRDEVFTEFAKKFKDVIKDCVVPNDVAEKDSKKYTTYTMQSALNKGIQVSYDKEKLQKYKTTLEEICAMVPQPDNHGVPNIRNFELMKNSTQKGNDIKRKRQELNTTELFMAMCEEVRHFVVGCTRFKKNGFLCSKFIY